MKLLFTSFIFFIIFSTCFSQNQTCQYQFGDTIYDLNALSHVDYYSVSSGIYTIFWNFCGITPYVCSTPSAVCQMETNVRVISLGSIYNQTVEQVPDNTIKITYSNGYSIINGAICPNESKSRITYIYLKCETGPMGVVSYREDPLCTYTIYMSGNLACPIGSSEDPTTTLSSSPTRGGFITGPNNAHSLKSNIKITSLLSIFIIIIAMLL